MSDFTLNFSLNMNDGIPTVRDELSDFLYNLISDVERESEAADKMEEPNVNRFGQMNETDLQDLEEERNEEGTTKVTKWGIRIMKG